MLTLKKKTAEYILDVFRTLNREQNQTIIIVTHDVELSKKVQRVVAIRDGKISSERILKERYALNPTAENINWAEEETQEEFAIIDKAGRVQIPRKLLDNLELSDNKIKVVYEDGEIKLRKGDN